MAKLYFHLEINPHKAAGWILVEDFSVRGLGRVAIFLPVFVLASVPDGWGRVSAQLVQATDQAMHQSQQPHWTVG